MSTHYSVESKKIGSYIPIENITYLMIKIIVLTMVKVVGSTSPQLDSQTQMYYVIECMWATIYDWCPPLLGNLMS